MGRLPLKDRGSLEFMHQCNECKCLLLSSIKRFQIILISLAMQSPTEKFRHSYPKVSKIQEITYLCTFLLVELRLPISHLPEGDPAYRVFLILPTRPSVKAVVKNLWIFRLDISKIFFTISILKPWNRLPREVSKFLMPGNIQDCVGWGSEQLDLLEDFPACCRRWLYKVPFNPNFSVVLSLQPLKQRKWKMWFML